MLGYLLPLRLSNGAKGEERSTKCGTRKSSASRRHVVEREVVTWVRVWRRRKMELEEEFGRSFCESDAEVEAKPSAGDARRQDLL